jgi:hypothetical protein
VEEKKVPALRFRGFDNAWEQCKLSDIYQNIGNAFVGTATPYYVENGHFYLESNNIKEGFINHNTEIFINDEFYEKQKDKWLHTGDIVMVQSGHVGHTAVIPEELNNTAAHALIMFRNPKEKIEPYFLNCQYQTFKSKKKIDNITVGNTIKHILASDMQEFVVDFTSYEEQSKIAVYFKSLDNLIILHQRKLEMLKKVKKSMLEKMFPKNDAKVPEVRFSDFTDAWEQRKLGELSEKTYGGGTPSTANAEYWCGNIPWLQSSDIIDGKLFDVTPKKYISQVGLKSSAAQLIPENSIAIITRVGVGKLAFLSFFYTTSQDFLSMSRLTTEPYFTVYACYKKLQSELNSVQGTSIKGITKDELLAKEIKVPSYDEQKQIGEYFTNLDHLISLHQRKLEKLKNIKKSMLEKMFII